jgi:glycosyltransferase involved in cell wall biosynthesis
MMKDSNEPIRVMRVIARMNVGGPAAQISSLMRGISSHDFDHRLYTGFCGVHEADYLDTVATDVKAFRIKGLGQRISLFQDLYSFFVLVHEIRSFRPHIIHTHTAKAGLLGRAASIASLHSSIRVHTFHGHLLKGYFGKIKTRVIIFAEQILALFTHQLLAVGSKVRQDLLDVGVGRPKKFGLMPPGVKIGKLPAKMNTRLAFGLSRENLQCAYIGRVTHIKRPDRFLDVVEESRKRGTPLDFFMAGDGDLMEYCREEIRKRHLEITLLGWQTNIEKILAAADIVLLTSDNEGTPLSLIQAGMAGIPVVTTGVGSIPEVVLHGKTGFITSENIKDLADALEKLTRDKVLRRKLGSNAKDFTNRKFGVERLVRDHEELYKTLMLGQANF